MPPYYYSMDAANIEHHYRTVAAVTQHPIIMYNLPQRTGNDAFDGNLDSLLASGRFVAMKDSSGNFIRFSKRCYAESGSFKWLQGEDFLDASSLLAGAAGVVSGLSNIFPELYTRLCAAIKSSDLKGASDWQRKINMLAKIVEVAGGKAIPAIKISLELLGRCKAWSRVENTILPAEVNTRIGGILNKIVL
jgi:4-hydroxy-tetrahydrodipicolinate synthase